MTPKEIQHKIHYEILVDCYDDYEVNMSWFYFFQDELEFPFEAELMMKYRSGHKRLTKVDVLGIEEGDFNLPGIHLEISLKDSELIMEVDISKLKNIVGSQPTLQAFEIWNFWKSGSL